MCALVTDVRSIHSWPRVDEKGFDLGVVVEGEGKRPTPDHTTNVPQTVYRIQKKPPHAGYAQDLNFKLRLRREEARSICRQLKHDSKFLKEQGIMDYSLLLGVRIIEFPAPRSRSRTVHRANRRATMVTMQPGSTHPPAGGVRVLVDWLVH